LHHPSDLAGWLGYLEARNREAIVLGLDRVLAVAARLGLKPACPVITVAGTNGKGSVCAYLEAMLLAAGLRVGCYTSPHLRRYNERVRIAGREARDGALCEALAAVESARTDTPLTYFEQGTLAALWLFQRADLEAVILEVGLGGRLDAVNIWDADCAIVSSVDLDHQSFLGDNREAVGLEKAGIFRTGRPAVCGDAEPPASLLQHAASLGTPLLRLGREIQLVAQGPVWSLRVGDCVYPALPRPIMAGAHQLNNAACAIAALQLMHERLPVPRQALRAGLLRARLPGRFQIVGQAPLRILDVAHNPQAARVLAANLAEVISTAAPGGRVLAVFALLADKDAPGVIAPLLPRIQRWHVAGLHVPRGLPGEALGEFLRQAGADCECHAGVVQAWQAACREAGPADTICAFGSFYTVAELLTEIEAADDTHD
jgi:dihydrofolate synthase/folylpolyglutamate synthase